MTTIRNEIDTTKMKKRLSSIHLPEPAPAAHLETEHCANCCALTYVHYTNGMPYCDDCIPFVLALKDILPDRTKPVVPMGEQNASPSLSSLIDRKPVSRNIRISFQDERKENDSESDSDHSDVIVSPRDQPERSSPKIQFVMRSPNLYSSTPFTYTDSETSEVRESSESRSFEPRIHSLEDMSRMHRERIKIDERIPSIVQSRSRHPTIPPRSAKGRLERTSLLDSTQKPFVHVMDRVMKYEHRSRDSSLDFSKIVSRRDRADFADKGPEYAEDSEPSQSFDDRSRRNTSLDDDNLSVASSAVFVENIEEDETKHVTVVKPDLTFMRVRTPEFEVPSFVEMGSHDRRKSIFSVAKEKVPPRPRRPSAEAIRRVSLDAPRKPSRRHIIPQRSQSLTSVSGGKKIKIVRSYTLDSDLSSERIRQISQPGTTSQPNAVVPKKLLRSQSHTVVPKQSLRSQSHTVEPQTLLRYRSRHISDSPIRPTQPSQPRSRPFSYTAPSDADRKSSLLPVINPRFNKLQSVSEQKVQLQSEPVIAVDHPARHPASDVHLHKTERSAVSSLLPKNRFGLLDSFNSEDGASPLSSCDDENPQMSSHRLFSSTAIPNDPGIAYARTVDRMTSQQWSNQANDKRRISQREREKLENIVRKQSTKLASNNPLRFATSGQNTCIHCKNKAHTTVVDQNTGLAFCTVCFSKLRPKIPISSLTHRM